MFTQHDIIADIENLRTFALHLTRNQADAEKLVHSTLHTALEDLATADQTMNVRKWTTKIMFSQFVANFRGQSKLEVSSDELAPPAPKTPDLQAINHLSPRDREILTLVCVKGMTYMQTAEMLSIPLATVRTRLSHARENLQQILDISEGRKAPTHHIIPSVPAHIAAQAMMRRAA